MIHKIFNSTHFMKEKKILIIKILSNLLLNQNKIQIQKVKLVVIALILYNNQFKINKKT